jgi:menaquinone-dependent protoporphyrinogen oxidase
MGSVLVVFESRYGQSEKIAARVIDLAKKRGHAARMIRADLALKVGFATYDLVVLVAPVYYGKPGADSRAFVRKRLSELNGTRSAFVSVSGAAGDKSPARQAEAKGVVMTFLDDTGWRPMVAFTAGGAMAYPRYNVFLRAMVKWISKRKGGPTDTSKVHETTDWDALDANTNRMLDQIERHEHATAAQ